MSFVKRVPLESAELSDALRGLQGGCNSFIMIPTFSSPWRPRSPRWSIIWLIRSFASGVRYPSRAKVKPTVADGADVLRPAVEVGFDVGAGGRAGTDNDVGTGAGAGAGAGVGLGSGSVKPSASKNSRNALRCSSVALLHAFFISCRRVRFPPKPAALRASASVITPSTTLRQRSGRSC